MFQAIRLSTSSQQRIVLSRGQINIWQKCDESKQEKFISLKSNAYQSHDQEEKIKRKLKFFFMNPADKYHATRSVGAMILEMLIFNIW